MRETQYWFYGQACAFITFLHKQGLRHLWDEYLRQLVLGGSGEAAFARSFANVDLDELERRWKAAVLSGKYD